MLSKRDANPLVSIIVPSYNHALFLPERLDSINQQVIKDYEVILLDDASCDQSQSILESFYETSTKATHLLLSDQNSGSPFSQWNKGLTKANGKYIWIAESDDTADPEFLLEALRALESGAFFFFCRCSSVDANGIHHALAKNWADELDNTRFRADFLLDCKKFLSEALVYRNVITNASSVVCRRDALACLPPEATKLRSCGDWLVWSTIMAELSGNVAYSCRELCGHRAHSQTTRHNVDTAKQCAYAVEVLSCRSRILRLSGIGPLHAFAIAFSSRHRWIADIVYVCFRIGGRNNALQSKGPPVKYLYLAAGVFAALWGRSLKVLLRLKGFCNLPWMCVSRGR